MLAEIDTRRREFDRARKILGLLMAQGGTVAVRQEARRRMAATANLELAAAAEARASSESLPSTKVAASADRGIGSAEGTFVSALRRLEPGETRVFGTMISIECDRRGVVLVVEVGARQMRVRTSRFESIQFIIYRD